MGTSLSSIHVYSTKEISGFGNFKSLSEGWQTYIPDVEPENPLDFQKLAKRISKSTDAPVMWFYIFDSDAIYFQFYINGKRAASYAHGDSTGCKNLYGIPAMVGYESGEKRRLSKILSCGDIDYQLTLLEEYFGVCLVPLPEIYEEAAEALCRKRGDAHYKELLAEEKKYTGKRAAVKLELIWEQTGKIFTVKFHDVEKRYCSPHYYYYGYDKPETSLTGGNLRPMLFKNGKFTEVTQEEFDAAPKVLRSEMWKTDWVEEEYYPAYKIKFTDKAPEEFRNKVFTPPRGFYFFCFDEKGRVLLSDERSGIVIVDGSLKIIAKMRVKGEPADYLDGHILTAGSESHFAYYYNPSNSIRVYRVIDGI